MNVARRVRVLVVEDDPDQSRRLQRAFGAEFDLEVVGDAERALERLADQTFDVVFSDYELPGHNGAWLLAAVRERQPRTRRVLTSAGHIASLAADPAWYAVEEFVPKPAPHQRIERALLGAQYDDEHDATGRSSGHGAD